MANIKSQIKRNRQNERRRVRNIATRSEVKTHVKTALQAAEAEDGTGDISAEEATRRAVQKIDKAAAKGVLHRNTAARKKSRLMKRIAAQS